jgi:DNA-binding transcriptional LysR family regulator
VGSFRKASKILNVNESAISRRIRDLEDRIGVALFIRHHGGIQLTEAGQRFVALVKQGLNQIEHATSEAGSSGRGNWEHSRRSLCVLGVRFPG